MTSSVSAVLCCCCTAVSPTGRCGSRSGMLMFDGLVSDSMCRFSMVGLLLLCIGEMYMVSVEVVFISWMVLFYVM